MTGREKIEAAFSEDGTRQFAAVIPYMDVLLRDHWVELTGSQCSARECSEIDQQVQWARTAFSKLDQDWFMLNRLDSYNTEYAVLAGSSAERSLDTDDYRASVETEEQVDQAIMHMQALHASRLRSSDTVDLNRRMLQEFGGSHLPFYLVHAPFWRCNSLWGFEGLMRMTAEEPSLVRHACSRFLELSVQVARQAKTAGAELIWIEDCLSDMVSPSMFSEICLPCLRDLVEAVRYLGMKSVHYFCGNPVGKWDLILDSGADGLALEESKKGFLIDIEDVVDRIRGRMVMLGNLDSVGVLQNGTDESLKSEICRQLSAGRRNKGRFIMSLGSPVTPATPIGRVQRFCDMIHEVNCDV